MTFVQKAVHPEQCIAGMLFARFLLLFFARCPLSPKDWHKFKKLLASKTFAVHDTKRMRGEDLTARWATESGFREPVIALDKTGMGLKVMTKCAAIWLALFGRNVCDCRGS